jgi:hypothetical protein
MTLRRGPGRHCSDEVSAQSIRWSPCATAAILVGAITGFASLPVIFGAMNSAWQVAAGPAAALHIDELPTNIWPLPLLQYAQPAPPPEVLPPANTPTPADLARYGPTNNAPAECAALVGDGARSGDNCAYARRASARTQTRDERLDEIQKILAARDLHAEILVGWHGQPKGT